MSHQWAMSHGRIFRFLHDYEFDEDIDLDESSRNWTAGDQLILRWKYCKKPVTTRAAALI